ncbi:hypothetical protein C943_01682 [Mariniradius saccharolyticus AK6]|uniref:Outer membrane protein H n=1 Tax=Mariniradius saccharolyticus AK6 TaxID=1239962 RepID=M7XTY8_9BACT|nr:OmpH family outer membrane protein [Mariniradius saccharolyticus]EMS31947.1 hypothetical protein C943_01682 [Mariniradius saccharolyticus AK6]
MKKLLKSLVIAGVAVFAISACNKSTESTDTATTEETTAAAKTDIKIAYVQTDSLIAKYTFYKEKSGEITEKGKRYETELGTRARGFEQEVANFQQTATSMTMNQARAKEEELAKKQNNLVTYRDNLMRELSEDEAKLYADVYDQVQTYLTEYAKENGIDMILSYTRGGAVWYSDAAFDVTDKVLEGLNKKYEASKTAPAPAATPEKK